MAAGNWQEQKKGVAGGNYMYRVSKVLNHNTVIAVGSQDHQEYLIMGKGIGFGKRVSEQLEVRPMDTVYSLQKATERGDARKLAKSVPPVFLEIASELLMEAEKVFGRVDKSILFPMADHIEYAVKRIRSHEQISNPLNEDIRVLFHEEYKVAQRVQPLLKERMGITIGEDETGYIALHIHSAIEDDRVSDAMQMARAVHACVSLIEQETGRPISVTSLSYNRLMNHIRYMIARALRGEQLRINMNDYMGVKFPKAFQIAEAVCAQIESDMRCKISVVEVGYLAMHIERVADDELGSDGKL